MLSSLAAPSSLTTTQQLDYHHDHLIAHKEAHLVGDGEEGHDSVVSEIYIVGKRVFFSLRNRKLTVAIPQKSEHLIFKIEKNTLKHLDSLCKTYQKICNNYQHQSK